MTTELQHLLDLVNQVEEQQGILHALGGPRPELSEALRRAGVPQEYISFTGLNILRLSQDFPHTPITWEFIQLASWYTVHYRICSQP